jgi:MSHA biogenesis protein MshN
MSLVNKMLRDLDARRAGDGERAALPAAVTPLAARQESDRGLPLTLLAVVVAAGLGAAAWYGLQASRDEAPAAAPVVVRIESPAVPPAGPAAVPAVSPAVSPAADVGMPSLRMAGELSATPMRPAVPSKPAVVVPKAPELPPVSVAPPRLPVVALPRVPTASGEGRIDKQVRVPSPSERAEIDFRRGVLAQRQGNAEEAAGNYRAALEAYAEHAAARQTLAALLIEAKRFDEAEELLRKGMEHPSTRLASTLALARLKVERNQVPAALELLQKNAASGERSAEYQGFAGALLNRAGRAAEAVEHYQAATRLAPSEGRWWAGLGISLDAAGKASEAREAYQKARSLPGLPADLAQHIEQRLR